jgi:hypothetical protein
MAIPKFIQLILPLPPLSTMVQSRLGVAQVREAQVHLPTVAIPKFIQIMKPFEEKAEIAITKMGKKQAKSYRSLRKTYQETGDLFWCPAKKWYCHKIYSFFARLNPAFLRLLLIMILVQVR